jgi:hypothetical protein
VCNRIGVVNSSKGFSGGMARFNAGKDGHIDLPDRRWKVSRVALRFVFLFPSKETRFVLPHEKRVSQNRLIFDPNNLLVNENATVSHRFLDFDLTLRGVPNIDRSVVFANCECSTQKRFIEGTKRLRLLLIGVSPFPVLILAVGEVFRGVVLRIVGHQTRRMGGAEFCGLSVDQRRNIRSSCTVAAQCCPISQIWPGLVFHFSCSSLLDRVSALAQSVRYCEIL